MDTLRGQFGSYDEDTVDEDFAADLDSDDIGAEAPPSPVGQDERRMQVRAYNHWAGLLADRNFPSIEDLDPEALPDFGPYSVLLDFTGGIDNPAVQFLGDELAQECGTSGIIRTLDDVPSRSLLSRITDHYMQILANQAPIGFEAEFVNQRDATILYRGILLPFSSDDDTIDFIYGVINWKEVADQLTTDELLLEIDQALESEDTLEAETEVEDEAEPVGERAPDPVTDWADGPAGDVLALNEGDIVESGEEPGESWGEEAALGDAGFDEEGAFGEDDFDDESEIAEFTLPDIGEADEEDTINHDAYASLMPSDGEEEATGGLAGLGGLRNKPAKKPLDLSITQSLSPFGEGDDGVDEHDDFPVPAFGQEDDRFASLLGSNVDEDEEDENADDWASPLDLGAASQGVEDTVEAFEDAPLPGSEPFEDEIPVEETPVAEAPVAEAPVEEAPVNDAVAEPAPREIELPAFEQDDSEMGLYDTLAQARELAQVATSSEDRSRAALYEAVSRAYDVSLAAAEAPEDFAELVEENGLTMQDRAPMTPVVKLVFGADYDKTRLTEYATVLTHAHRQGIERGALKGFLAKAEGGLKGVVQAERRLRREEEGKEVEPEGQVRSSLAKKLRKLELHGFDAVDPEGPEFGVVVIRRLGNGEIAVLGDCSDDIALVEKAARKLVG